MDNPCQTPVVNKLKRPLQESPLNIPPTPQLTKVGYGTGVSVYQFNRPPKEGFERSPWALKKINHNYKAGELKTRLKKEAEILQELNHPNIVGYRGFINRGKRKKILALEKCCTCLGTMKEERMENSLGPFPADIIMKVAFEIAKGLDYLHHDKHLLHGDIKSYNILIKNDFESIKLCDFGVSLPLTENGTLDVKSADTDACYVGTPSWSAPEIINSEETEDCISSKADIFSFGITLWELMTLGMPHFDDADSSLSSGVSTSSTLSSSNSASSTETYSSSQNRYGTRPALPSTLGKDYQHVIQLFNACTEEDPQQRPSAAEIIEMILLSNKL